MIPKGDAGPVTAKTFRPWTCIDTYQYLKIVKGIHRLLALQPARLQLSITVNHLVHIGRSLFNALLIVGFQPDWLSPPAKRSDY